MTTSKFLLTQLAVLASFLAVAQPAKSKDVKDGELAPPLSAKMAPASGATLKGTISGQWSFESLGFTYSGGPKKLITSINLGSPVWMSGLREGDEILELVHTPGRASVKIRRDGKIYLSQFNVRDGVPLNASDSAQLIEEVPTTAGLPAKWRIGATLTEANLPECRCLACNTQLARRELANSAFFTSYTDCYRL